MEAQTTVAAQAPPEQSLAERLNELHKGQLEGRTDFLGRAAGIVAEYNEAAALTDNDKEAIERFIPWKFNDSAYKGRQYGVARRIGWMIVEQRAELSQYDVPKKRQVSTDKTGNVLLLARNNLQVGDLQVMVDIEKTAAELASEHQAKRERQRHSPEPKKARAAQNSKVPTPAPEATTEPETIDEPEGIRLNDSQEKIIKLFGWPLAKIADELNIKQAAVRKENVAARRNNSMGRPEFLAAAVAQGKIDMSLLPEGRVDNLYRLTMQETKVLNEHPFDSFLNTAGAMHIGQAAVAKIWHGIYTKMGLSDKLYRGKEVPPTRERAFLIGIRDGRVN